MITKLPFYNVLPCGVCRFSDLSGLLECRAKERIPQKAKSVIVYLFPYYLGEEFYLNSNISKYAVPEDYHNIVLAYLETVVKELKKRYPHNKFCYFCDNSPVKEVEAAFLCGLGVLGKNSLLINKDYGSFVFIGEIVTDLEFTSYSLPEDGACLNCGICEKNCPGRSLNKGKVNKEYCLSHITQKKGELSLEEQKLLKNSDCIWGCDLCQNQCPMNKNIKLSPVKEFYATAKGYFAFGDSIKNRAFGWRGEKVINRNFKINSCKDY